MAAASDIVLMLHVTPCHAKQSLQAIFLTPVMLRIMLTEPLDRIRILLDSVALQCLCMLQVCKSIYQSITCAKRFGDVLKEHQMKLDGAVVHVSLHPEPSKCIASFAVGPPVVADFATDTVKPLPAVVMGETHTRSFLFSLNMQSKASSSDEGCATSSAPFIADESCCRCLASAFAAVLLPTQPLALTHARTAAADRRN